MSDEIIEKAKEYSYLEVTSGARHAIKNELELLKMLIRMAESSLPIDHWYCEKGFAKSKKHLAEAEECILRMSSSLDIMKYYASINIDESGEFNVYAVIDEALNAIGYRLDAGGIKVNVKTERGITYSGEKDALLVVFTNLLINSVEAFGKSKKKRGKEIYINTKINDKKIIITYSDNAAMLAGEKLDKQSLSNIWEPGYTSKSEGSGFGLPFARHIIQNVFNGNINLSGVRPGLQFTIELNYD